jgi:hypothetical protein
MKPRRSRPVPVAVRHLALEERLGVALEVERRLVLRNAVPDAGRLPLRRWRRAAQLSTGVALGLTTSVVAILVNFVLFNMLFHVAF